MKTMKYDQFVIGGMIQDIRKDKKITQFDMAERLNISLDHYSKLEQGAEGMSLGVLFDIMTVLDVDANTILLYGKDNSRRVERVVAKIATLKNVNKEQVLDSIEMMIDSMCDATDKRKVS